MAKKSQSSKLKTFINRKYISNKLVKIDVLVRFYSKNKLNFPLKILNYNFTLSIRIMNTSPKTDACFTDLFFTI